MNPLPALFCLSIMFVCGQPVAQMTTMAETAPQLEVIAIDRDRDVLMGVEQTLSGDNTWEFDGANWYLLPVATPSINGPLAAYHGASGSIVAITDFWQPMWAWDGTVWANAGQVPLPNPYLLTTPTYFGSRIAEHTDRQTVVLLIPGPGSSGIVLQEWDGTSWAPWPTTNAPPTRPSVFGEYRYGALAYDERRERLVLYGRREYFNGGQLVTSESRTWECDASGNWTEYAPTAQVGGPTMWFDRQRGRVLCYQVDGTGSSWIQVWADNPGAPSWSPVAYVPGAITQPMYLLSCYDPRLSRVYTYQSSIQEMAWLTDVYPAKFEPHAVGCTTPNAPELALTEPWTRAWLGGQLEVTVSGASSSIAALAVGLSDQQFGATPLPLALAPIGMPGCQLNVSPDVVLVGVGAAGRVPFAWSVPLTPTLVGVEFWQQALILAPGANPAGLLLTDSVHLTIGKSR